MQQSQHPGSVSPSAADRAALTQIGWKKQVSLKFLSFQDANFLKVVSSAIVDKYIGESARLIREMFNYARDHQPCIIFMDEIDAIGGRRSVWLNFLRKV